MTSIKVKFKDGTIRDFPHQGRAGGSYSKSLSFEGAFVIVTDEWGQRTAFPAVDVVEVIETPARRY